MSQFMGYFRMVLDKNRRVFRVLSKESVFVHTTESEKRKKKESPAEKRPIFAPEKTKY